MNQGMIDMLDFLQGSSEHKPKNLAEKFPLKLNPENYLNYLELDRLKYIQSNRDHTNFWITEKGREFYSSYCKLNSTSEVQDAQIQSS